MKLYCPICFYNMHVDTVLEIAGYPTKKPLHCSKCNKSFTYDQSKKTKGA